MQRAKKLKASNRCLLLAKPRSPQQELAHIEQSKKKKAHAGSGFGSPLSLMPVFQDPEQ